MRHSLPYRMLRKRPMKLSTTVILMVSAVLFSVLLVVHLIYFSQISDMTRDGLANKALAVAQLLPRLWPLPPWGSSAVLELAL